jgi:hypothetical protein
MSLAKKVKTALDETRLLILGAQVLFGFQLNGVFQEKFSELPASTKLMTCLGQALMTLSLGLLIAPSMQHRLVEEGEDSNRIHRATGTFAGWALLPFEVSLGLSVYVVFDHLYGPTAALIMGSVFCIAAGFFWYGLEFGLKFWMRTKPMVEKEKPTPLPTKIDQMLTEARVVLPGAQALLGFQLTVTLTRAFNELPAGFKLLHVIALCCVAIAVILLMTPAALHRITFEGEDTPQFFRLGSRFVIAAPAALAFGITGDLFVASYKSTDSIELATGIALAALVALASLWFAIPLYLKRAVSD